METRLEQTLSWRSAFQCTLRLVTLCGVLITVSQLIRGQSEPTFRDTTNPKLDSIGDRLPENAVMRLGTHRFQNPTSLTDMVLSPDQRFVITADREQVICWEAATGAQLWKRQWNVRISTSYGQHPIAFAGQDSEHFYTPGDGNSIRKWHAQTGTHSIIKLAAGLDLNIFFAQGQVADPNRSIDVSADKQKFLVGSGRGVALYNADGKLQWNSANNPKTKGDLEAVRRDRLFFGGDFAMGIFSPDESMIAVTKSEAPDRIEFLGPDDGKPVSTIELSTNVVRMAFAPDGKHLYATGRDCSVRCYNIETGEAVWTLPLESDPKGAESYACGIACSPDGGMIAACVPIGSKYWIYLLSADSGEEIHILKGGMWKPWAVQFTGDSKTVFSTGWDGAIRRWDVKSGKELALPVGVRGSDCITISADGLLTAFCDGAGQTRVLETVSGQQLALLEGDGGVTALEFSPDSKLVYAGSATDDDLHIRVWDFRQDEVLHELTWPKGRDPHSSVEEISADKAGKFFAAAVFRQSKAYIWDARTGKQVAECPHRSVYGLSLSPDGETLATAGWDRMIRLWDTESGERVSETQVTDELFGGDRQFGRLDLRMYTVEFSPNGNQLAVCPMSAPISVWSLDKDRALSMDRSFSMAGHTFGAMDWSASGAWIVSGSNSGKVRLFDAQTGDLMLNVGSHTDHAFTVRFGGERLIASGGGGVSYVWDISTAENLPDAPNELWDQLRSSHSASPADQQEVTEEDAFRAIYALAANDAGVEYVVARLEKLESVVDPAKLREKQRTGALGEVMRRKAKSDDTFDFFNVAHRAVTALKLAKSDQARRALETFATSHASDVVRQLAAESL